MINKSKVIKKYFMLVLVIFMIVGCGGSVFGEVYFYWDSEDQICDSDLPWPPFNPYYEPRDVGRTICGLTPEGSNYFEWQTLDLQEAAYNQIEGQNLPVNAIINTTYYLASFFNVERIDGKDVWHETAWVQSGDKAFEIQSSNLRWIVLIGHWDHHDAISNNTFTAWLATGYNYDYWPQLDQNQNGYDRFNPIELEYERWYSAVMGVTMSNESLGKVALWINGVKILEHENIQTCNDDSPVIWRLQMAGTIAQPAYDAPAHVRKHDALLLTDDWQDIVNGEYLSDPEVADTFPPTRSSPSPTGNLSSGTANTTIFLTTDENATCRYSNVSGTNYSLMNDTFSITGEFNHSTLVMNLTNNQTYNFYVRCNDTSGNFNTDDFLISFGVSSVSTLCGLADTDFNGNVSMIEVIDYMAEHKAGNVTVVDLVAGIDEWKMGC